jgi:predicted porin
MLFPSFYYFSEMAHIPDEYPGYALNYSIGHFGLKYTILPKSQLTFAIDGYTNFEDYNSHDSIPKALQNQTSGFTTSLAFGTLKKKGHWLFKATYGYIERYSAVDYFAQNDIVRWDYSNYGSPDGRLTNYQCIELVAGYAITEQLSLTAKYYMAEQLVSYGTALENGMRFRFDIDIRF